MIRLNVFIEVSPDKRQAAIEIARELVMESRNDEGCVAYDLFESTTRNGVLMICETWKDIQSLTAHTEQPHYTTLVPKLEALGMLKAEKFNF